MIEQPGPLILERSLGALAQGNPWATSLGRYSYVT